MHICWVFFNGKILSTIFQSLLLSCADENEQNESKLMKADLCICYNSKQQQQWLNFNWRMCNSDSSN